MNKFDFIINCAVPTYAFGLMTVTAFFAMFFYWTHIFTFLISGVVFLVLRAEYKVLKKTIRTEK